VTAIVAGSAALLAIGTSRVHEWVVMTDELLYAKLARHTAETGSPLPVLHGDHVGFLGVVYPLVLSPFYGAFDAPGAFGATHIVNAVLFASAAIPATCSPAVSRDSVRTRRALLSCRAVVRQRGVRHVGAGAYPVFLGGAGVSRRVSEPSARRDALAVGALALAFFTRPQFLFLAACCPCAADRRRPARRLAAAPALAIAYAVAIVVVSDSPRSARATGCSATTG
jgi:hypothetical protein